MVRRLGGLSAIVAGMLTLAVWCGAVDFSAVTVTKVGTTTVSGKVYRRGASMRQETNAGGAKQVFIVRPDKKAAYMIDPTQKTYMEMPQKPGSDMAKPFDPARLNKFGKTKKVGSEKINGFVCDKILFTPNAKSMGSSTFWYSKELQYTLKMVSKRPGGGDVVMETRSIKTGSVPPDLFNVPKGYKKKTMPKMPQSPGAPKRMPAKPVR